MSTTNPLARLMKRSPFKGMQEHMRVVLKCTQHIPPLIEAQCAGDAAGVKAAKEEIFTYEAEADAIKNHLRAQLPKSLFMPVDRRDLLDILVVQDSIADTAQDIAGLLIERPMEVPEPIKAPLCELAHRCVETCAHAGSIIEELDELVATGFRGREAATVEKMLDKLNELEDGTDELGLSLARTLFEHEEGMNPVSVIMWYRIIEWIGDLADYAEKVGDRLRLLIAQ